MQVLQTIRDFRAARAELRRAGHTLGLVPTMGALHAGHMSLVQAARAQCDAVAASIFVNPTQFAPGEDFDRYPRTLDADLELLRAEGVELVFAPSAAEMYPPGQPTVIVDVPEIGARLDGASRPGHFRGVATVVSKLFHVVDPERAFFGQKDAAQVAVLRAMVRALDMPVELVVCPIVRDGDGLALSSRNRYLSPQQRADALALPRALADAANRAATCSDAPCLRKHLHAQLESAPGLRIDYAEVVDPDTLLRVEALNNGALLAAAVWVGNTRLIDNVLLPARKDHA